MTDSPAKLRAALNAAGITDVLVIEIEPRARNRPGLVRAARYRELIRATLAARNPLLPPITAEQLKRELGLALSVRQIQNHMSAIRRETELAELDPPKEAPLK